MISPLSSPVKEELAEQLWHLDPPVRVRRRKGGKEPIKVSLWPRTDALYLEEKGAAQGGRFVAELRESGKTWQPWRGTLQSKKSNRLNQRTEGKKLSGGRSHRLLPLSLVFDRPTQLLSCPELYFVLNGTRCAFSLCIPGIAVPRSERQGKLTFGVVRES